MSLDQLNLVARVDDKFTSPLKSLRTQLKDVGNVSTLKGLSKDFGGLKKDVGGIATELRAALTPALGGVGMAGLGVGSALAGVSLALKGFATGTREVSLLSKELGISADHLRTLQALGERSNVAPEGMQGALKQYQENLRELRRNYGETLNGLRGMNLGNVAADLQKAPGFEAAIERALKALADIPDPVMRRRVSRLLFGTDDLARIAGALGKDIGKVVAEIQKNIGQLPKSSEKAAEEFAGKISTIKEQLERLKVEALSPLLTDLNGLATWAEGMDLGAHIREFSKDVRGAVGEVQGLARELGGLKELNDALNALTGADKPLPEGKSGPFFIRPGGPIDKMINSPRAEIQKRETRMGEVNRELQGPLASLDTERARQRRDELTKELKRLADEVRQLREKGALVQPQRFQGLDTGFSSLIHKASLRMPPVVPRGPMAPPQDDDEPVSPRRAPPVPQHEQPERPFAIPRVLPERLLPPHSGPDSPSDAPPRISPRLPREGRDGPPAGRQAVPEYLPPRDGIFGGMPRVLPSERLIELPKLRPARGGLGMNDPLIALIRRKEGTSGPNGFNTSLANGALLPGGRDTTLTDKTFREIHALQTYMLRNPRNRWTSSAIGAGQFVRSTLFGWRGTPDNPERGSVVAEMGISPDQKFDEETQLRMMDHLIRRRGRSARGLGNEWEGLKRFSNPHEILAAYAARQRMLASGELNRSGQGLSRIADADLPPQGSRMGDQLMMRSLRLERGGGPTKVEAIGNLTVDLNLNGALAGARARTSLDGMFKNVALHRAAPLARAVEGHEDR
jgi:hypothetical protein